MWAGGWAGAWSSHHAWHRNGSRRRMERSVIARGSAVGRVIRSVASRRAARRFSVRGLPSKGLMFSEEGQRSCLAGPEPQPTCADLLFPAPARPALAPRRQAPRALHSLYYRAAGLLPPRLRPHVAPEYAPLTVNLEVRMRRRRRRRTRHGGGWGAWGWVLRMGAANL